MRNPPRALAALLPLLSEGCYDFLRNTDEVASGSGSSTMPPPISSDTTSSSTAPTTTGALSAVDGSISASEATYGGSSTGPVVHSTTSSTGQADDSTSSQGDSTSASQADMGSGGGPECPTVDPNVEGAYCDPPGEGMPANGPACDKDCTVPKCGDSIFNPEATQHPEQCDEGLSNSDDPSAFCKKNCQRNGLLVFVTSKDDFTGDIKNQGLSGIPAADLFCNEAAHEIPEVAAAQGSNFLAWLSTRDHLNFVTASPDTDFKKCGRPYFLPKHDNDRVIVAESYKDLTTEKGMNLNKYLQNPIFVTEKGMSGSPAPVLTGTRPDGQASESGDCFDFNYIYGFVRHGSPIETGGTWSSLSDENVPEFLTRCETPSHIYCFEQCPP